MCDEEGSDKAFVKIVKGVGSFPYAFCAPYVVNLLVYIMEENLLVQVRELHDQAVL